jgi:hypothetical protein
MTTRTAEPAGPGGAGVVRRRGMVWAAGLVVALGAGVATAHGLYGVATAARVPAPIAWLYPLITDGLALVAYAATARLTDAGRRYAWTVVVLAAGLSGLAQASYLAGGVHAAAAGDGAGLATALRFGVGAWPALAAAIVAHLLHLLDTATPTGAVQPLTPTSQPAGSRPGAVPPAPDTTIAVPPPVPVPPEQPSSTPASSTPTVALPVPATGTPAGPEAGAEVRPAPKNKPTHTDAQILAALADRTGPVAIHRAAEEFRCGPDRARRLLAQAGLLDRPADPVASSSGRRGVPVGSVASSGRPHHQPTLREDDDQAEPEDHTQRRALRIVQASPDQPRTTP